MRFLIDSQLPPSLTSFFESHGVKAEHVSRVGLGGATDAAIWAAATRQDCVLITKDEDFVALAQKTSKGPSVVWVRIGNCTNQFLRDALTPILDDIVEALANGERIIEIR